MLEWGEKLIAQLVEAKLVSEPADLYKLKPEQIAKLERRGMVIAQKVLDQLKATLPLSLPKFLAALGIENFGLQTAKALVAAGFDSIEKVQAAKEAELAVLPGVGPAKAQGDRRRPQAAQGRDRAPDRGRRRAGQQGERRPARRQDVLLHRRAVAAAQGARAARRVARRHAALGRHEGAATTS